jgi:hypothetical protein
MAPPRRAAAKSRRSTLWIVVITLLAIQLLPVGALVWWALGLNELILGESSQSLSRNEIESLAHIKFPAGARNIRSYALNFRGPFSDPEVYVRFEMPAGGREAFIATTRCPSTLEHVAQQPQPQTLTQLASGPNDLPAWWDPDQLDTLDCTAVDPETNPGQHIMFGKTDAGDDVVYVYAF